MINPTEVYTDAQWDKLSPDLRSQVRWAGAGKTSKHPLLSFQATRFNNRCSSIV
jgi:hypothetical protein